MGATEADAFGVDEAVGLDDAAFLSPAPHAVAVNISAADRTTVNAFLILFPPFFILTGTW
ncbi:hypothetical protein D3C73_763690 [compost metagenome]